VQGDYEAVFPLAVRTRLGVRYAHQPFFTRYFGVYGNRQPADATPFLAALPARIRHLRCGPNRLGKLRGVTSRQRQYQLLSLDAPYETLRAQYAGNTLRNIRKAEKAGLTVRWDVDPALATALFRKTRGGDLREYGARDYAVLRRLAEACRARGEGRALAVYGGEELLAAAFFMGAGARHVYLKGGVTAAGRGQGAMPFLFDRFIAALAGRPAALDFGGSSVASVARFYRGFGASDVVYLQVTKNRFPFGLLKP
jgi:hypothetical protein